MTLFLLGNISVGNILTILPFGDLVDMIKLKGEDLWAAFENSVAKYDPVDRPGAFLQVSGMTKFWTAFNRSLFHNLAIYKDDVRIR